MNVFAIPQIQKEQIPRLLITHNEVLPEPAQVKERRNELERACALGNSEKGKVYISFLTEYGPVEVHTTIWNVSKDHIGLKGGILLPVHAILSVRF